MVNNGATSSAAQSDVEQVVSTWTAAWRDCIPRLDEHTRTQLAIEYASRIRDRQRAIADAGKPGRTLHRKAIFATTEAQFTVSDHMPIALQLGPFTPGRVLQATVRLSNASGHSQEDAEKDQRGMAVRLTDGEHEQDLLATNWPVSHAKDTSQFIAATALLQGFVRGAREFFASMPLRDAIRMLLFFRTALRVPESIVSESFYSRSHFQLGDNLVEFRWVPVAPVTRSSRKHASLTEEMVLRVREGAVKWRLELRGFTSQELTPIDDGRAGWSGAFIEIGKLEIPRRLNYTVHDAEEAIAAVDRVGFSIANRWSNDERILKGRGLLNEFREEVYAASQQGRGACSRSREHR